ncbi:MAG: NAD(P)H-binding protein, partial [Thermoleophilaceae bacterium]
PVRCLVRDPRRLGAERVRVQIALGDLSNPASFRHALRGVDTVVHLAAAIRDQEVASIEEVNGVGTLRLLRAARRSGTRRFVFFSAMGATLNSSSRFFRAKALAEQAVLDSDLETTVFAPSIVYSPGDYWLRLLERLSYLPALPVSGSGRTLFQPIWADDVAACVMAVLGNGRGNGEPVELAGPETLSHDQIIKLVLRSLGRRRRLLHVPLPVTRVGLNTLETVVGPSAAFATWEEAELMEIPMTTPGGTAGAESLGIMPLRMAAVLGAS